MYTLILIFGMIATYFVVLFILSKLFQQKPVFIWSKITRSLFVIVAFTIFTYISTSYIEDEDVSNRLLHAIGGGFNVVLATFLVIKDFKFKLDFIQFGIIAILLVSFFGIGNEIIEYFLQTNFDMIFASTSIDTWLDLISNGLGGLLGTICLGYFIKAD